MRPMAAMVISAVAGLTVAGCGGGSTSPTPPSAAQQLVDAATQIAASRPSHFSVTASVTADTSHLVGVPTSNLPPPLRGGALRIAGTGQAVGTSKVRQELVVDPGGQRLAVISDGGTHVSTDGQHWSGTDALPGLLPAVALGPAQIQAVVQGVEFRDVTGNASSVRHVVAMLDAAALARIASALFPNNPAAPLVASLATVDHGQVDATIDTVSRTFRTVGVALTVRLDVGQFAGFLPAAASPRPSGSLGVATQASVTFVQWGQAVQITPPADTATMPALPWGGL